ncbi:hemolysin family protein [Pelagibacterium halotolerans]|uniref:Hemolysins-related protein containing CBS domains n=1 Tax=Pelagibacterium halotolerans (strain DSM 22347 / JCM 15775 / CGMCC 1.7692 / B2) TaxID=1082931 RepID=G4R952_PELHB|nr:hemolysin family protein [Pelagibacterium halotolerans]AEQ52432.1 hemolysins-related protein containing CBS domains [Pelagibacterium halotolerans B2]QJR17837.1 HlyC/CorC family transporter [Pelagibacterium halotolerans]SEA36229.1 putative hemolysin [Pelagibacterium halotolerans]
MIEITIVAGLILLNGVFAMSELAVVSASKPLLRSMAERGQPGASAAVQLADDPGRFLSTVQIGITLIGIIAGAFSGATIGGMLTGILLDAGLTGPAASALGYGGVVAIITYLSVVVGELVPKQLALRSPERVACLVAPPMRILSRVAGPVVWLLDASTRLIFRLLGLSETNEEQVTEEEIKSIVAEAAESGVIERDEKRMIAGVLRLSDRRARSIMTPRTDVEMLDFDDDFETIRTELARARHSRLPVSSGEFDNIIGVLVVRDYLAAQPADHAALKKLLRKPQIVPDTLGALDVLNLLRRADFPLALVLDEYGHFDGIVTPTDLLEAIAGVFRSDLEEGETDEAVQREDGSWLLAGGLMVDDLSDRLGLVLPEHRDYQTLAGFIIDRLQHLPRTGEVLEAGNWRLEVVDMDGHRVDKVLAIPREPAATQ